MSWLLGIEDLPDLARGAALLGTGGGGDPTIGMLLVRAAMQEHGPVTILDPDELDDDAFVIPTAQMGAPTVVLERIPAGPEPLGALRRLEAHLGRTATATMPIECGGINSMIPLLVGATGGLPVVDADGMGRAFPELQMETFSVYGVPGSPLAISDERGHGVVIETGHDNRQMEWLARGVTIRLGGVAYIAEYAMTGRQVRDTAVPRTLSLALAVGRAVRHAREAHRDPVAELAAAFSRTIYTHLRELHEGKVVDVERRTVEGFARGRATISGAAGDVEIVFQNENLVARRGDELLAVVPDLICVLDAETAEPITTERLRYGQRVRVVGVSTPALMRTPEALAVFGPACFGLDDAFTPVEVLHPQGAVGDVRPPMCSAAGADAVPDGSMEPWTEATGTVSA
ncbi:DUF917 domain-containing protein [Curtobacterium sp. MCBD17_013]|uniref:DUF917 domain-containing protein n=1 Tax=unclassified Curtobacterium TaxID=257496 RepID=UPI000DAA21D8|nr:MULTISPECIES: DUF917 domain-containing protein [unclassified Curtobacterium]PZF60467.1 DUF917 domain-containing protein [Curtobacterium sp. MCBD17_013]WIB66930.1 DUF917 domain-containing protein [Curtobacterium sp. MCBD17_035]